MSFLIAENFQAKIDNFEIINSNAISTKVIFNADEIELTEINGIHQFNSRENINLENYND